MTRRTYILEWASTPPSLNDVGYRTHWAVNRKIKLVWQDILVALMWEQKVKRPMRHAQATMRLRFPTKRQRDEGNFRVMVEKALGDALVIGQYIPDDTPEHYTFGPVQFEPDPGPKLTRIWLEASYDD